MLPSSWWERCWFDYKSIACVFSFQYSLGWVGLGFRWCLATWEQLWQDAREEEQGKTFFQWLLPKPQFIQALIHVTNRIIVQERWYANTWLSLYDSTLRFKSIYLTPRHIKTKWTKGNIFFWWNSSLIIPSFHSCNHGGALYVNITVGTIISVKCSDKRIWQYSLSICRRFDFLGKGTLPLPSFKYQYPIEDPIVEDVIGNFKGVHCFSTLVQY